MANSVKSSRRNKTETLWPSELFFFTSLTTWIRTVSVLQSTLKPKQNKKSILLRGAHIITDILPFQGLNGMIIIYNRHIKGFFFLLNNGIMRECLRIVGKHPVRY